MIGLTPIGRATIEMLKLNRSGVVNLRRLLRRVAMVEKRVDAEGDEDE